eukprot:763933-Hanusia_phi.AAC.1
MLLTVGLSKENTCVLVPVEQHPAATLMGSSAPTPGDSLPLSEVSDSQTLLLPYVSPTPIIGDTS